MSQAAVSTLPRPLTYAEYLAEGVVEGRYEIADGQRTFMATPNRRHQRIVGNVYDLFRAYERREGWGQAFVAPADVLISSQPLKTRQPDVLFISHARLAQSAGDYASSPLLTAPEVTVEVRFGSETDRILGEKIADYQSVGVQECWVIDMYDSTVRVLDLTRSEAVSVTYIASDMLTSAALPNFSVPVAEIFAA